MIEFKKERKQSKDYLMLIGKKFDNFGFSKRVNRKRKINKIFDLGLDIKDEFSPSKSIMSRYSTKMINSKYYETIKIKKPTL